MKCVLVAICLLAMLVPNAPASAQVPSHHVAIEVFLQGPDISVMTPSQTCVATNILGGTQLTFGNQAFDLDNGEHVSAMYSATERSGCRFEFTAMVGESKEFSVSVGNVSLGTLASSRLPELDYRIEILLTRESKSRNETTWRYPAPEPTPTPKPTSTPEPSPTPGPTPQLGKTDDGYRIGGTFVLRGLNGDDFSSSSGMCFGLGGYQDIQPGAQVVVKDQTGDIVAVSTLEPDPTAPAGTCQFVFFVDVPDAKFYSISVTHRGELVFSKQQLEANGWLVELSLG